MNESPETVQQKVDVLSTMTARQISDLQVRGVLSDAFVNNIYLNTPSTAENECQDCDCLMVEMTDQSWTE